MKSLTDLKEHFLEHKYFLLLITLLCAGAYLNILDNAFVSDDIVGILNNPNVGEISESLKTLNFNMALKDLVFLCFGRSPLAYHIISIILHILATILVYFFILILTEDQQLSSLTTALFALHPIHTEAVTWISGRGYPLYSIFFLLSFLFYHLYLENEGKISYLLGSLVCYALALFSWTWALPLVAVFFLYEVYLRGKKIPKINWSFYLGLAAICGFYLLVWQGRTVSRFAVMALPGETRSWANPAAIVHIFTRYLYLLFWPMRLSFYHEGEILTPLCYRGAAAVSLAVFVILPLLLRRRKLFVFFLLFFLVVLSFFLSPLQVTTQAAERYLYLASISFCVLTASLLLYLERRLRIKNLAVILLIPILVFYFVRTFVRNQDWRTPETFWAATVEASPRSPRAHSSLGEVYSGRKDWDGAIREFAKALEVEPDFDLPTYNLGVVYLEMGDLETARAFFLRAAEVNPSLYQTFHNLGVTYFREGNLEEAKKYFEKTLVIRPYYPPAQNALRALANMESE